MDYLKKLLIVFMLLMILAGCGKKSESSEVAQNVTTAETEKVEARTAIIFKQIDNKTVSVKRENETLESYEGMRLLAGDRIITGEDTTVYIRIDDDKNILLDNQTTMAVDELSSGKLVMYLEEGAFFFDLENKLSDGEEVSFDLGGTTMSIRGTSGQGSRRENTKSFAIFTGLGSVTDNNGMEAELTPNTKVEFVPGSNGTPASFSFSNIQTGDILNVTKGYVAENKEYQQKVENSRWAQEVTGNASDNGDDGSGQLNDKPGPYGWIQQADGSWIFSKEAFDNKTESAYYVKPSSQHVPSYNPAPAPAPVVPVPQPEPTPTPTPTPAPTPEPQNICEHCGKEIKAGEEELHTIMGSDASKAYRAKKYGAGSDLATMVLCNTHYLCELTTIDYESLNKHSYHKESNVAITPEHFTCEDGHLLCEDCSKCKYQDYTYIDPSEGEKTISRTVQYYEVIGKTLCNICVQKYCEYCGNEITEVNKDSHLLFSNTIAKNFIYKTYTEALKSIYVYRSSDLDSLNICDAHRVCEMNLDKDINNLLLHVTGTCTGCSNSFCSHNLTKCTQCSYTYCSNCLNDLNDGIHEYVNGVLGHKD